MVRKRLFPSRALPCPLAPPEWPGCRSSVFLDGPTRSRGRGQNVQGQSPGLKTWHRVRGWGHR